MRLVEREPWTEHAACRGLNPTLFFPEGRGSNHLREAAKAVCHGCPVRRECLDYAIEQRIHHGIFGGLSVKERHRHRKDNAA